MSASPRRREASVLAFHQGSAGPLSGPGVAAAEGGQEALEGVLGGGDERLAGGSHQAEEPRDAALVEHAFRL